MQNTFDASWRTDALAGDSEAVARLVRWTVAPLFRFCYYRVGKDEHLCEDVVQETLLRAIDRLTNYEPARSDADIFPWLTGLARNEIRCAPDSSSGPKTTPGRAPPRDVECDTSPC